MTVAKLCNNNLRSHIWLSSSAKIKSNVTTHFDVVISLSLLITCIES